MRIEQVERGISGIGGFIKQNPLMVLGILALIFLVVLFARPERRAEEAIPQAKHDKLAMVEPPIYPQNIGALDIGYLFEDVIIRQEMLAAQIAGIHDALRADRVEPVIDYRVDPQRYVEQILGGAHIPPRPRKNDKIWVAEGRWEPIDNVKKRQRQRFERALARGDKQTAEVVRKETELALGQRLVW